MTIARERALGRIGSDTLASTQPVATLRRMVARAMTLFRCWREREQMRREVASMSGRDFGDLPVPPGLIADECRRWPWRRSISQWGEIRSTAKRQSSV
jgi:uncharacterized protein YjiS (DUF1127 family)